MKKFPLNMYEDAVQEIVRKMIGRSLVMAFALFQYKQATDVDTYIPVLPLPHDACIKRLVEIVQAEEARCIQEINLDAELGPSAQRASFCGRFRTTCDRITKGFIAKQILGTMSTVQVGKNWNSHGADLSSSLCQLAALLCSLNDANEGDIIEAEFPVLIPQGNVLTGHKHGYHDVVYVEYMTAAIEPLVVQGGKQNYLTHGNFVKQKHGEKVSAIMGKTLPQSDAPVPRPTHAHTFDFNLTYGGARLIDGEWKGTASEDEKGVMVLHTLDQLALKETGLAMLTTNNSFAFYRSRIEKDTKTVKTEYDERSKFDLGPVYDIENDLGCNLPEWQTLPSFDALSSIAAKVVIEEDREILTTWQGLRSELRQFLSALIYSLDVLTADISKMNFEEIGEKQAKAYTEDGWGEPRFCASGNAVFHANRPIHNQNNYIYWKRTMDPEGAQPVITAEFGETLNTAVERNPNMSQDLKDFLEKSFIQPNTSSR